MLRVLPPMFKPVNNLISYKTGLLLPVFPCHNDTNDMHGLRLTNGISKFKTMKLPY